MISKQGAHLSKITDGPGRKIAGANSNSPKAIQ